MNASRSVRNSFRPSLGDSSLEDRVVLAVRPFTVRGMIAAAQLPAPRQAPAFALLRQVPATAPFRQAPVFAPNPGFYRLPPTARLPVPWQARIPLPGQPQAPGARALFDIESRELQLNYNRQIREVSNLVTSAVRDATRDLYALGTPTPQQLADVNARIGGIANAAAFQLSSQIGLLPGSEQTVARLQDALIGGGANSLVTRLQNLTQVGGSYRGNTFDTILSQTINNAIQTGTSGYANLFRGNALYNATFNPATGRQSTLSQYIGGRLLDQVGNTLGMLNQTYASVGNAALFANGATTATPEALQAFGAQAGSALSLAAAQLGSGLALFPNVAANTIPTLQNTFFGTTPGASQQSIIGALGGLQTSDGFSLGVGNAFGTGYDNIVTTYSGAFGLTPTANPSLPTGNFSNVFGSQASTFGNGFNNGFNTTGSTSFYGFGTPGVDFNTNLAAGFNTYVSSLNQNLGFTNPGLTFNNTTGIGTGS